MVSRPQCHPALRITVVVLVFAAGAVVTWVAQNANDQGRLTVTAATTSSTSRPNPPTTPTPPPSSSIQMFTDLLDIARQDCHDNQTHVRWMPDTPVMSVTIENLDQKAHLRVEVPRAAFVQDVRVGPWQGVRFVFAGPTSFSVVSMPDNAHRTPSFKVCEGMGP